MVGSFFIVGVLVGRIEIVGRRRGPIGRGLLVLEFLV